MPLCRPSGMGSIGEDMGSFEPFGSVKGGEVKSFQFPLTIPDHALKLSPQNQTQ